MMSRDTILGKVRDGVRDGEPMSASDEHQRRATVAARLAKPVRNLVPERASAKSQDELVALLKRWLEMAGGELTSVVSAGDVPRAVADFLRRHNLPQKVRIGGDQRLAAVPWRDEGQLEIAYGPAAASDTASVTHALAAIAETATVMVPSGPENPVTLSFLPENNIVLVARDDIVGPLEDAIARLRGRFGGAMPRTVNLISGPSRSADVGGIPVLGAHGPKRLCVIVVG
jgi:L-lactate dehydrogenase complex protein LldG